MIIMMIYAAAGVANPKTGQHARNENEARLHDSLLSFVTCLVSTHCVLTYRVQNAAPRIRLQVHAPPVAVGTLFRFVVLDVEADLQVVCTAERWLP